MEGARRAPLQRHRHDGSASGTSRPAIMYQWVVFVHIVAAIIWIGGMLFLPLVLVPVLRRQDRSLRTALLDATGRRFRTVGWVAISVLLITGVWNLHNRRLDWDVILSPRLFDGPFGHVLAVKLALIAAVLVLSLLHDFGVGPASTRAAQDSPNSRRAERLRRAASWIGRVNALLALTIIWLGVALVRGLP
jgi:putative copper resistance protein D